MTLRIPSLLVPIIVGGTMAVWGQEPETPVFRAGVTQVRLDVQVLNGDRVLPGLEREDFAIFDENTTQPIAYFAHEDEPLAVLLLLDVSGSMKRYLEQMGRTAQKALGQLGPNDRVGVMVFSKGSQLLLPLSNKRNEAAREIEVAVLGVQMPSGTAINSAVIDAAQVLKKDRDEFRRPARRSVLILTDNGGLSYQISDDLVIRQLLQADSVLNAIIVGKVRQLYSSGASNTDFTPADVGKLAAATGGETLRAERADEAFPELISRLRNRYSLAYAAPESPSGTFRRVRVELSPAAKKRYPRARVLTRTGYYAP